MPVTPTYPGVYIEELPSAVRTIVGVATSITAFVGFTKRGPADRPVDVFNFGDFERAFGGLDVDSPLSYAVQQFFLNGGGQAIVVRAAHGATIATVELENDPGASAAIVLKLSAKTAGQWANAMRITVDRDTTNPDSLFNLTVTEYVPSGTTLVPGNTETFRNLTMDSTAATYAVDVIKANSKLLDAARGSGVTAFVAGVSITGDMTTPLVLAVPGVLQISQNGGPPLSVTLSAGTYADTTALATALQAAAGTVSGLTVAVTADGLTRIKIADATTPLTERSSIHVSSAPGSDLAARIKAGLLNGGREIDGIAKFHPAPTGSTAGTSLTTALGVKGLAGLTPGTGKTATVSLAVKAPATGLPAFPVTLLTGTEALASKEELRARLEAAIQATALANPSISAELAGARVALIADRLVVSMGGRADASVAITNNGVDLTAQSLGFPASIINLAAYSPSIVPTLAQATATLGDDGTAPGASEILGTFDAKTGMYALRDVDLFNLLVLPDALGSTDSVLSEAMTFCEAERAFLVADLPESANTLALAQDWIKKPATPKSANAAAYFPRPLIPDSLQGYRPRKMAGAGAIAGLFARTDASRGIWKAPAGTDAALRGPTSFEVALTDMENGTINPLGLNANRAFPVYGNVVWGARTLVGSDQMASQWKYIPVRRVALFIEESLYRGTKWVVFEPNDEPLWAQIRLSIGTFMHGMFRQGAFQGASPRQAYLVKCDSETTTQADIDLGIVNIIVGFAPLKPAEFVVIKITQLAGQLEA